MEKSSTVKEKEECYICGIFYSHKTLKKHLQQHTNPVIYECSVCNRRCKTQKILKVHWRIHEKPFLCKNCGNRFESESALQNHACVRKERERSHTCSFCNKAFCSRAELLRHEYTHTEEKPFNCELCGKGFAQRTARNTHMQVHTVVKGQKQNASRDPKSGKKSKPSRNHICQHCQKAFLSNLDLIRHTRIHTNEKPFECEHCGQRFTQKSNRDTHAYRAHSQSSDDSPVLRKKNFICEYCFYAFPTKQALDRHVLTHTGERPFVCEICQKSFSQQFRLKHHMNEHTNEVTYECERCGKQFKLKESYNSHVKLHFEPPSYCSECNKTFATKWIYESHLNKVHRNIKRYSCDICDKKYYLFGDLKRHYLSHTKRVLKSKRKRFDSSSNYAEMNSEHSEVVNEDKADSIANNIDEGYSNNVDREVDDDSNIGHSALETEKESNQIAGTSSDSGDSTRRLKHNGKEHCVIRDVENDIKIEDSSISSPESNRISPSRGDSMKSELNDKEQCINSDIKSEAFPISPLENPQSQIIDISTISGDLIKSEQNGERECVEAENDIKTEAVSSPGVERKPYLCHVCRSLYADEDELEQHHAEYIQGRCCCCMCHVKFESLDELLDHHPLHNSD